MNSISILGSGWLGLPLAEHFVSLGFDVRASTRSEHRLSEIQSIGAIPFVIDIEKLPGNIQDFLRSSVLIINITAKNPAAFNNLIGEIEKSAVEKVLLVSSTSVYANTNRIISETDGEESPARPLLVIENLFRNCQAFATTIVRFGGLIGYSRHPGHFFKPGRHVDQPESNVNLIHRDDCVAIIGRIIERGVWGEVFNACADTHPTKREFYSKAAQSLGLPPPEFADSEELSFKIISNTKLKHLLDYRFCHPDLMSIDFGNDG